MIKNRKNSEHYTWGTHCSGWPLVNTATLSIIEECMPPNTEEVLHYHKNAQQFFYILRGTASFIIENEAFTVNANEGIHILPRKKHQIINKEQHNLEFLVISEPTSRGDKMNNPFLEEQAISLDQKKFKVYYNSEKGEVSGDTIFHYREKKNIVWATYEGGDIIFGTLSGERKENTLYFTYQHQNKKGEFKTGKCTSILSTQHNKIILTENWKWTSDDFSKGTSTLKEI